MNTRMISVKARSAELGASVETIGRSSLLVSALMRSIIRPDPELAETANICLHWLTGLQCAERIEDVQQSYCVLSAQRIKASHGVATGYASHRRHGRARRSNGSAGAAATWAPVLVTRGLSSQRQIPG